MTVLAYLWWLWLALAILCFDVAIVSQIDRFRRMLDDDMDSSDVELSCFVLISFVGGVFFLMFLISIVWLWTRTVS
jgi:hypothetical protein